MNADELHTWFARAGEMFGTSYLAFDEPWTQSGMSGPAERWALLRKPIADCMDHPGTFLDIGCANGYLMECCAAWTAARDIAIDPYGADISAQLIAAAQQRLPKWKGRFWIANAFEWLPPMRFDYVRTELVYVPAEYERQYIEHLLKHYLTQQGRLLIANYNEDQPDPARGLLPGSHPTRHIVERLGDLGFKVAGFKDGFDPKKGNRMRVAILAADDRP